MAPPTCLPHHKNSATGNIDDWYTCLFNDAASITDQSVKWDDNRCITNWAGREKEVVVAQFQILHQCV